MSPSSGRWRRKPLRSTSRTWEVSFPTTVDVDGFYLTNAWNSTSTVQLDGYRGGTLVDSTTVSPSNSTPTWVNLGFTDIDELTMTPSDSNLGHFVVDELTYWEDSDGDGYVSNDCDDTDPAINPGATELCDGVDNNCDGTIDEDSAADALLWYADSDSDGYGDVSSTDTACSQPSGYVSDYTDCDDGDGSVYPGAAEYCDSVDNDCDGATDEDSAIDAATWYADSDSDGFGDASVADVECSQPSGYVSDNTDCDDSVATTYPGADEYCNSVDDNCDGNIDEDSAIDAVTWYADSDSDSYGDASVTDVECAQPSGYLADDSDCDDNEATTYPGADEYCDGADNNCDGDIDEDSAVDVLTWYTDSDSDGFGDASSSDIDCDPPSDMVEDDTDCDDTDATVYPGAEELEYDGIDQDCDGEDLCDVDRDGYNAEECGGDDCDDEDEAVQVDAAEVWYDGIDQDCDELSDYDADYDGYDSESYEGDDCDDADPDTYPGAPDEYYDGIINDCVDADEYDADGDGYDSSDYGGEDCDDANSSIQPEAEEIWYDGLDQDCDELSDYDADGDGYDSADYEGEDCDDEDPSINPDADESWYDGVDQDCDGQDDDQDDDGYTADEDCDDLDPDSYPGAEGLDEDCEPTVEESSDGLSNDTGALSAGEGSDEEDPSGCGDGCGSKGASTIGLFGLFALALGRCRRD